MTTPRSGSAITPRAADPGSARMAGRMVSEDPRAAQAGTLPTWADVLRVAGVGLAFGAICALLLPTRVDSDLWGHLRFGLDMLHGIGPDRADPYSYLNSGVHWINHETLAELALAAAFRVGRGAGLVALKALVVLALLGMFYRRLRAAGLRAGWIAAVVIPAAVLLLPRVTTVRPQLFSTLLFAVTLDVLLRAEAGRTRTLWALPPLMALWINTHGAVLAGLGVVLVWAAAHALSERRVEPRIAFALLASVLALVVNPYGTTLPLFLVRTATVPRPDVAEWAPLRLASSQGIAYLLLLGLVAAGIARTPGGWRRPRSIALATVAVMPLTAVRHTDLFAVAAVLLGGDALAAILPQRTRSGRVPHRLWPVTVAAAGLLGAAFAWATTPELGCVRIDEKSGAFPVRALATLNAAGVRANMAVPIAWGEYVIWRAGPRIRVSIDGRRETVYPDSLRNSAFRLMRGEGNWDQLVRDPRTDLVLASVGSPAYNLMRLRADWTLAYSDDTATVFARVGSALLRAIGDARPPDVSTDGAGLCLEAAAGAE